MKKRTILLLLCLLFASVFVANPASAGSAGLVGLSAHYAHPVTGVVEDPGNDAAIGQGMTESVLGAQGLYEVDDAGNQWLTVRLSLAGELGDCNFAVQNRGDSTFYHVAAEEVARNGDTVDMRFQVPAADAIIRLDLFVNPMGRAVIFYGVMDGSVVEGHGDFIVHVAQDGAASAGGTSAPAAGSNGSDAGTAKTVAAAKSSDSVAKKPATVANGKRQDAASLGEAVGTGTEDPAINGETLGNGHGLLTKDSPELAAALGEHPNDGAPWGPFTRALVTALIVVLALFTLFLLIAAVAGVVGLRVWRRHNDRKEALLYDAEDRLS